MRPVVKQVLGGIAIIVLVFFALWQVPKWQVEYSGVEEAEKRFTLEDKARGTLAQIFGGLFILAGLYFTYRRITATERNVEVAQEGQITERFTRAIGQLGDKEHLEVRLGGIYALERIAKDSPKDHWTIMEVLTAFVRENARWEDRPEKYEPEPGEIILDKEGMEIRPPADIQAILTVLGRRERTFEQMNQYLDLNRVYIRGAYLVEAHLEGANLPHAHLERVNLTNAHLERVNLPRAHMEGAALIGANLSGADLRKVELSGAELSGANLYDADLRWADLREAELRDANLRRASLYKADLQWTDLSQANGLTREQIASALTNETTRLPDYLKETGKAGD